MSWGRSESTSQGRPMNVRLGHPLDVISRRLEDVGSGCPRDGQIESLGEILETNICRLGLLKFICIISRRKQLKYVINITSIEHKAINFPNYYNNDFKVTSIESVLINKDHPSLNKKKQVIPLELSDS